MIETLLSQIEHSQMIRDFCVAEYNLRDLLWWLVVDLKIEDFMDRSDYFFPLVVEDSPEIAIFVHMIEVDSLTSV